MSIEAMKQALVALETCRIRSVSEWSVEDVTPKNIKAAIESLRTAIQQAETEPVGMLVFDEFDGHCFIPNGDRWPFNEPLYTHPAPGVPDLVMVGLSDGLGAWQPIATAPRTGKTMLMWSRKAGFFSGNWPQGCAAGDWHKIGCDWRGGSDWRAQEATHWMPLPAPPVSA